MGIVKSKPADIKPENDLNAIPDDLLGPIPAVVQAFGKDLLIMDKPPEPGQLLKIEITLRCKDIGKELLDGGDFKHYRKCKSLGAKVTTEPYMPEVEPEPEPEPGLLDEAGRIPEDNEGEPGEDGGLNEFDPAFSHNGDE